MTLALFGSSHSASALCFWDRDGIREEAARAPQVADLLTLRFSQPIPEVWAFRLHAYGQQWALNLNLDAPLDSATVFSELEPHGPAAVDQFARVLGEAERLGEAVALLERAADAWPARFPTWANLATAQLLAGQVALAADAFRRAQAVAPAGLPVTDWLALVLQERLADRLATDPHLQTASRNLLNVDFDAVISSDWRMRPADDIRPQQENPTETFAKLAPRVAAETLRSRLAGVLPADVLPTVDPGSVRATCVQLLTQLGIEEPWTAPLYELLGETCTLHMDRALAFRAYVIARRLYLRLAPEHRRADVCRRYENEVRSAGMYYAEESYDLATLDTDRRIGREYQQAQATFERRCLARGLDPGSPRAVLEGKSTYRPSQLLLPAGMYLAALMAAILLMVIWLPAKRLGLVTGSADASDGGVDT